MPTLLIVDGFKFFFYANDHEPPHVHVLKGERWAKIEVESGNVVHSTLKRQELRACLALVAQHRQPFLEQWYDWFNR